MNANILLITLTLILSIYILCNIKSNFDNIAQLKLKPIQSIQTTPTIAEQKKVNDEFLKEYSKYKKMEAQQNKDKTPFTWNENNTLESMVLKPCLSENPGNSGNSDDSIINRMTCYSAPAWWYPKNKYSPDKFREVYYGDYYNPIYNYLGNAQEMYWDFKSVKN